MKNYLLKVDKDEVVVSESEYSQIKEGIRSKMNLVFLREGKLAINPIMIKLIRETNRLTEAQEKEHEKRSGFSLLKEKESTKRVFSDKFQKAIGGEGGEFKNCEACGEYHFLVGGRDICLCCATEEVKV